MPMRTESRDTVVCTEKFYRWGYAVFAGVVACAIVWGFAGAPLLRIDDLSRAIISWPGYLILGAVVCARFAAGHAARIDADSHGAMAAILTWLFYSGALALLAPLAGVASLVWTHGQGARLDLGVVLVVGVLAPMYIFIVSSFIVLPACAAGTALFNGFLEAGATLRRWLMHSRLKA